MSEITLQIYLLLSRNNKMEKMYDVGTLREEYDYNFGSIGFGDPTLEECGDVDWQGLVNVFNLTKEIHDQFIKLGFVRQGNTYVKEDENIYFGYDTRTGCMFYFLFKGFEYYSLEDVLEVFFCKTIRLDNVLVQRYYKRGKVKYKVIKRKRIKLDGEGLKMCELAFSEPSELNNRAFHDKLIDLD